MRTVALSGLELSTTRLGFGTSGLHHLVSARQRQNLLAAAFAAGIRHFDTAPYYGHGIAEQSLGLFLSTCRGDVTIATKFGIPALTTFARWPTLMYAGLAFNGLRRRFIRSASRGPMRDYSAREAQLSLERSLRALKTDHVDVYFVHEPSPEQLTPTDELLSTLERIRREGKARYLGLAGRARDCITLASTLGELVQVFQVGTGAGYADLSLMSKASLPVHFSFGHFRGRAESTATLLADAVRANSRGVILYSSRLPRRATEVASLLAEMDRP